MLLDSRALFLTIHPELAWYSASFVHKFTPGVAYWMGHRRCLYRDYPLSEGALVAEVCNLIYANLPDHLELHCEVQYAKFVKSRELPKILQGKIRADLVIAEKPVRAGSDPVPEFIIEVKRASQIGQEDLFSRRDIPSEENIRYQSPTAITV